MIVDGLTGIGLLLLAVYDWKKHEITVLPTIFGGLALFLLGVGEKTKPELVFMALLPGIFLLFLSVISKESIGTGDGIVLCMLGLAAGLERTIYAFGLSLLLCGMTAGILLLLKKAKRKTELPYLPFLFFGYLCSFPLQ